MTEEEYIQKARDIDVELDELNPNSGLRFISKLCLNSLWGKFGQNVKLTHEEYIDNEKDFYNMITDDKINNVSLTFVNGNSPEGFKNKTLVYTTYDEDINFVKNSFNTNIYIACFTTGHARLRIYDMMSKFGNAVCYCYTDSVIYGETEYNT